MVEEIYSINCLPNEIISLILQRNNTREILSFGTTCIRFNDFVRSNQYLWKDITKRTVPEHLFKILEEYCHGDWLNALKTYHTIRKQVYIELNALSPKFYKQTNDIILTDVKPFFDVALSSQFGYNYSIDTLQDVMRKGNVKIDGSKKVEKPFTMTEMHYGKIVLRHLIHTFLSLKWVRAHMSNELPPEVVCNFFIQWIDTVNMHHDEDIEKKIRDLVIEVENILAEDQNLNKTSADVDGMQKQAMDRQVLATVTQVVYHQRNMAITTAANLDTLDITKVLDNRCGNVLAVSAIYQAVAKRCGVSCELIAFPNHLFLEWRDNSDPQSPQVYTVDPSSGALSRRRRCPFSQNRPATSYRYCPDSLLQYISSAFYMSMGNIRNWNTHNNLHLMDFLGSNLKHNSYRNFLPYLLDHAHVSALSSPLSLKHMSTVHMEIIRSLSSINIPSECTKKRFSVRKRNSNVKYAVGMICFHTKFDYVCVVRDWDAQCALKWQSNMVAENLYFGITQPFYSVIAVDQSERYVPQEYLKELARPHRLYYVEDVIATEFTHFDGFSYKPNDEKRSEYPNDGPIVTVYRERAELLF